MKHGDLSSCGGADMYGGRTHRPDVFVFAAFLNMSPAVGPLLGGAGTEPAAGNTNAALPTKPPGPPTLAERLQGKLEAPALAGLSAAGKKLAPPLLFHPTLRRVKHRLNYQLLDTPPYIPTRLLALRFDAKAGPPNDAGCRVWSGATRLRGDNGSEVGQMRLKTPSGSMLVTAPHVAWFLARGVWPDDATYLRRTCGQALCCAAAHLTPQAKVDRRRLSVAQVLECRELYWGQQQRHDQLRATSPVEVASRRLGITSDTVRRVVQGQRVNTTAWNNWELTVDEVRAAIKDAEKIVAEMRLHKETVWTHARLATRYGTDPTTVRKLLEGFLYKDVSGPTSAEEIKVERAKEARAEARRARQALQGDPTIAKRAQACG